MCSRDALRYILADMHAASLNATALVFSQYQIPAFVFLIYCVFKTYICTCIAILKIDRKLRIIKARWMIVMAESLRRTIWLSTQYLSGVNPANFFSE